MHAAVYRTNGGPEVLSYEELPDPLPGSNDVLVAVEAISIEGGDLLRRRGLPPSPNPRIEGYSAAGTITAVGPQVQGWEVGDRVVTFGENGSHAELRAVDAHLVWRVPDGLDMASAAVAVVGFGTAADALFRLAQVQPGEVVVVLGATGGVGVAAVQLAHLAGARVIGTGSNVESLDRLRPLGLNDVLVSAEGPITDRARALTGGRGADVLIDTVGGAALQDGIDALTDGGRAIMVGRIGPGKHTVDAYQLMIRRMSLIGCMFGPILDQPEVSHLVDDVLARMATGELTAVIDERFPLSRAVNAHRRAEERGRLGRVVMVP